MVTDTARRIAYTGVRNDVLSLIPSEAIRVLDVGCSNGAFGAALCSRDPGRVVHGVENDSDLANEARHRLQRVIGADLDAPDCLAALVGETYDCIVLADVLEHLRNPWEVLKQVTGLLRPGGSVVISVPNIRHISAVWAVFGHGTFPGRSRGLFDATHLRWFTYRDLVDLCASAGLTVEANEVSLRVFDTPTSRINPRFARLFSRLRRTFILREFFGYHLLVRARSISSS